MGKWVKGTITNPYLDSAPLVSYLEMLLEEYDEVPDYPAVIGCTWIMLHRMRKDGRIRFFSADRVCTRLGLHPALIFGTAWHTAFEPEVEMAEID